MPPQATLGGTLGVWAAVDPNRTREIRERLRNALIVQTEVELLAVYPGT